jgi:hypothetical protein
MHRIVQPSLGFPGRCHGWIDGNTMDAKSETMP